MIIENAHYKIKLVPCATGWLADIYENGEVICDSVHYSAAKYVDYAALEVALQKFIDAAEEIFYA